jgi:probable rRNA maturation factor
MAGAAPMAEPALRRGAPPVAVDLLVEAGDWGNPAGLEALAQRTAEATLAAAPLAAPDSELSLVFTDDAHIAALNETWRGRAGPTNVLSFPAAPPRNGLYGPILGDVVLARETLGREAEALGLTLTDHMTHLLVHGILHLLGHDHGEEAQAEAMERLETAILATLGIADPYAG